MSQPTRWSSFRQLEFGPTVAQLSPQDGGRLAFLGLIEPGTDPDAGSVYFRGTSGSVSITSIAACSISGSLDATFEDASDGGITTIQGTFTSAYCQ